MTNASNNHILDIKFVDSKEKLISLVREYINGIDTENVDDFDSTSKKFKQSIHFESIEEYIKDKLDPKSLEYLENAHGTSGYLGALFFELDIIFKDSLISFEYAKTKNFLNFFLLNKIFNSFSIMFISNFFSSKPLIPTK